MDATSHVEWTIVTCTAWHVPVLKRGVIAVLAWWNSLPQYSACFNFRLKCFKNIIWCAIRTHTVLHRTLYEFSFHSCGQVQRMETNVDTDTWVKTVSYWISRWMHFWMQWFQRFWTWLNIWSNWYETCNELNVREEGSGKKRITQLFGITCFFMTVNMLYRCWPGQYIGREKMSIIHVNQMLYNVDDWLMGND